MTEKQHPDDYLERLKDMQVPEEQTKEAIFAKIDARTGQVTPRGRKKLMYGVLSAAAAIVLLAGVYWVLLAASENHYAAPAGEQKVQTLPDGSQVHLNAGSKLSYREGWIYKTPKMELEGEAFFDVKTGKNFQVNAGNWTIEVRGTKFNVVARKEKRSVACYEGRVEITVADHNPHLLEAGTQMQWKNGRLFMNHLNTEKPGWMDGMFSFRRSALNEVWASIERQFNVQVEFDGDGSRLYTGGFNSNSLEEALNNVCKPMELDYRIDKENKAVYITTE